MLSNIDIGIGLNNPVLRRKVCGMAGCGFWLAVVKGWGSAESLDTFINHVCLHALTEFSWEPHILQSNNSLLRAEEGRVVPDWWIIWGCLQKSLEPGPGLQRKDEV